MNLAQKKFIQEMILHGDRAKAYKAAYPNCSHKTAIANASRLMAQPHILTRVQAAVAKARQEIEAEPEESLRDTMATEGRHTRSAGCH